LLSLILLKVVDLTRCFLNSKPWGKFRLGPGVNFFCAHLQTESSRDRRHFLILAIYVILLERAQSTFTHAHGFRNVKNGDQVAIAKAGGKGGVSRYTCPQIEHQREFMHLMDYIFERYRDE
jgi:hypothetical protein